MILVTGASGSVGTELVKQLWARGESVRALVRSRAHARAITLPGLDIAEGDFNKPPSVARSLAGVDSLFLLVPSSSEAEKLQRSLVDAAKRSSVRRIVKLSQLGADERAPGRFQRYHGAVESYIRRSGIPFTYLRPNLFMQSLLNFRSTISSKGQFYGLAGDSRVSIVDVRDIAAVAARVLTEPGHDGKTYTITGPEALTHAEIAEQLSEALGKPIAYVDVAPDTMREALVSFGLPPWQADGVIEDYQQYRRGEAAIVSSAVRDVTKNEPTFFFHFAQDYAAKFVGKAAGVS
ncbi:MAG TPA: SDR family oxidoreductase [Candidatus Bathyarchaeia archaeon]|nr:SDR family oxidoreductase [Candidatus Bathyarchaeia archaeon]